eukprot:m.124328 g.124328  ORF g.124328 m.124328 type:complete len:239 (-) comp9423_c1_seq4:389-1105(-)
MGNCIPIALGGQIISFDNGARRMRVGKLLAEGGFSLIYYVTDMDTGEKFAMKRMKCTSKEEIALAKQEIKYCETFQSNPNVIDIICHTTITISPTQAEIVYIVPLYRNGSLLDKINTEHNNGGFISEQEVLELFHGICSAVRSLHHHNPPVCHRDLKPGNVLLDGFSKPVLMDFGSCENGNISVTSTRQAHKLQVSNCTGTLSLFFFPHFFSKMDCFSIRKLDQNDLLSLFGHLNYWR